MKKTRYLLSGLAVLVFTHWLHYLYHEFMKVGDPFYNTVFSVPDLPIKFYQVNVGDKRADVEQLIGKPFYTHDGYTVYSTPGSELFWSNFNVVFEVKYHDGTVVEKRVIQDD